MLLSEETADPRVVRTRTLLRESLRSLVEERPFSSLTVKEITNKAGLNRTTFYLHYSGLHELLDDFTRGLFNELRQKIYHNNPSTVLRRVDQVEPYVELVFYHLNEYRAFYRSMLGQHGDPYFNRLFQDLLSELLFEPIANLTQKREMDVSSSLILRFYCIGFIGIATWWLDNDMPISIQEASQQISRDLLPGYMQLMQG